MTPWTSLAFAFGDFAIGVLVTLGLVLVCIGGLSGTHFVQRRTRATPRARTDE